MEYVKPAVINPATVNSGKVRRWPVWQTLQCEQSLK